ncbi:MAG TPA: hypothetical protein VL358_04630 [Caulobacteraceae bacterium]|jgi:hypothetical protein|nr:hypothetical protein [Caulobacteraceae bacterium]
MQAEIIRSALAVVGVGLVGYGSWLAWPPAGFLLVGAMLLAASVYGTLQARR